MGSEGSDGEDPPRRDSYSLRTIVEEVAGQPLEAFQDPNRTPHPYMRLKRGAPPPPEPEVDPVVHVYPPLVGRVGRELHGPSHEHHRETLAALEASSPTPASHPGGPSRRPERVYLHYLLLHLDRLPDRALQYLRAAVSEEISHRVEARSEPPSEPLAPPAE
jgi:hypothetical protein